MNRIGSVLFEPHGPLIFRGPMEFTPFAKGPQVFARTLMLPPPSTIAGCLATLLLDKGKATLPETYGENYSSWEEPLLKVLNFEKDAFFRGPYIIVNENIYIYTI